MDAGERCSNRLRGRRATSCSTKLMVGEEDIGDIGVGEQLLVSMLIIIMHIILLDAVCKMD